MGSREQKVFEKVEGAWRENEQRPVYAEPKQWDLLVDPAIKYEEVTGMLELDMALKQRNQDMLAMEAKADDICTRYVLRTSTSTRFDFGSHSQHFGNIDESDQCCLPWLARFFKGKGKLM